MAKSLIIVESPTKAKTISKFLGKDFIVEASIGHIRDLPAGKKDCPEKYKQEPWSYLGVDVDNGFKPIYIVPSEKKAQVQKLKTLLKDAKDVYLATDDAATGRKPLLAEIKGFNPQPDPPGCVATMEIFNGRSGVSTGISNPDIVPGP